jgi:hypothetical protein
MPIAVPFTMSTARSRHHIRHIRTGQQQLVQARRGG